MDARVSFITLAVRDRAATRRFYVDGLGWEPVFDGEDVLMFKVADKVVLSLWDVEAFTAEVGAAPAAGVAPITLAHNLATTAEVDAVLAEAAALGATVHAAEQRHWGGYSGYFLDPDGFHWEVAVNPSELGDELLPEG